MNKKNQKSKKKEYSDKSHYEKLEILEQAKKQKGTQLVAIPEDHGAGLKELDELKELLQKKIEDPKQKFELYYNGIQNILIKYLPKGKAFKAERQIIYDEKNIFLNRGKAKDRFGRRGSDGRMTYNEDLLEMVEIVREWATGSQDPVSLYKAFYDLNEKYDYGHQPYFDQTEKSFHRAMEKISKVPKPE